MSPCFTWSLNFRRQPAGTITVNAYNALALSCSCSPRLRSQSPSSTMRTAQRNALMTERLLIQWEHRTLNIVDSDLYILTDSITVYSKLELHR